MIISKLFSRSGIAIGEPVKVAKGDNIETRAAELGERLDALSAAADAHVGASPRPPRR